jgi:hypothetical protein
MKYFNLFFLVFALWQTNMDAQKPGDTDLLSSVGGLEDKNSLTSATFKGTRIINFHTVEVAGRRTLDFRIAHRFGSFNSGWYNFFGIDGGASIRLGLEYSHDGRFQVGIGRTSVGKMMDGFLKYRLLRQHDNGGMPISVTLLTNGFYTILKDPNVAANGFDRYQKTSNRLSFAHQIIIARKFSDKLSLQLSPTLIHYNQTEVTSDKNDVFVLGVAGRYKISKRSAITVEYGYRPTTNYSQTKYFNTLGIGYELETGGHVFQMFLTNSFGLLESQFLTRTDTQWKNGGIRLGFNVSRAFTLGAKKAAGY